MKRAALAIALFLILGAAINVAVAWTCAAWPKLPPRGPDLMADRDASPGEQAWLDRHAEPLPAPYRWLTVTIRGPGFEECVFAPIEDSGWCMVVEVPRAWIVRSGWPRASFEGGGVMTGDRRAPHRFIRSCAIGATSRPRLPETCRVLPLAPIWSGVAVNTVFYGAALWLLLRGPPVLRRAVRRRRGLCPRCAYPVGESRVCTECGAAVAREAIS